MHPPLPPEIRAEPSREGVRYLLPRRETGPLKLFGVFAIVFGCAFAGFAVFWMVTALGLSQKGDFQTGGIIFALFGLPVLGVGLGIIGFGIFILCGHTELQVRREELLARERGGPFWWTRRIPSKDIRRFTLAAEAVRVNGQPVQSGPLADSGVLCAEVGAAKPRLVAVGYPKAWLAALAERLNADLATQTGTAPLPPTVMAALTLGRTSPDVRQGDRFDPPARTTVRILEQAGGIVAVVPPQGARGTRGLLFFAIIWLVFISIVGAAFVFAPENSKRRRNDREVIPAVVIGAFGLIGVALLTGAINQMRRKASLRASRDELIIVQQSIFGTRTFKRPAGELAAIRIGPSGMEINHVPVLELQVHTTDGKKHGFCSNLTNDELFWLATHLRQGTGVGEVAGEASEPPKLSA